MVRASRTLKNPIVVPAALKNRVLMISCFLPLSLYPCVVIFLFISNSRLSFCASHTFSVSWFYWNYAVNCLHFTLLWLSLSCLPFFHLLNSRQTDLFTGVHSVFKVFKHHWMLWGGQGSRGVDTRYKSIAPKVSNSKNTLCYNRNIDSLASELIQLCTLCKQVSFWSCKELKGKKRKKKESQRAVKPNSAVEDIHTPGNWCSITHL